MIQKIYFLYRKFRFILLLLLIFPFFYFGIKAGWNQTNSDFPNYYVSSKLLLNGQLDEAYDIQKFSHHIEKYNQHAAGLFVMYPPTTALMTIYLSPFEILIAKRIWILLSIIAAFGIIYFMSEQLKIDLIDASIMLLISGFNIYNDLMLGQVYILMVFFIVFGWYLYHNDKLLSAGMIWGIVAAMKFLPLFFIPFFIFKKQFKISAAILFTFLFFHCITFYFGGIACYKAFIQVFIENYIHGKVANEIATSSQYQSIEALVNLMQQHYFISNLSGSIIKILWKLFWISLCFVSCYKYINGKKFVPVAIASISLLLLLFEHGSATYHLLFCLIVLLTVFELNFSMFWKICILCAYFLLGFLPYFVHFIHSEHLILNFIRLWSLSLFSLLFFLALKWHDKSFEV
ncbi:MAG TPA: glycosyltransferase family 87 protein [Bacteroidia bacterium]|nr:glycosyltransferase family 87 protein [Bacteroidia bacterium]